MSQQSSSRPVFRLGIAMAGAVSAGAYTAGVIDYLLEALTAWEQAKEKNRELSPDHPDYDHTLPMHDVVIEVIGGASAGAMTAAIMAMALAKGIEPIRTVPAGDGQTGNLLYDAWVGLNDEGNSLTLNQMFKTDDIQGNKLRSILNSLPIRRIGEKAKEEAQPKAGAWPSFVSKELQVLLTISNLRGIPISIAFEPSDDEELATIQQELSEAETLEQINDVFLRHPGAYHTMRVHKTVAHFDLKGVDPSSSEASDLLPAPPYAMPIDLNDPSDRQTLVDYAIASGAFPVALSPVDFAANPSIRKQEQAAYAPSREYFTEQIRLMYPKEKMHLLTQINENYQYTAVDGGTLNNEPFGEVMNWLKERGDAQANGTKDNYALIIIDPFPSSQEVSAYKFPQSLSGVASQVISTLRGQAMVKEGELRKGFEDDYTVAMVVPTRKEVVDGEERLSPYPIACGSLEGFGGFFHRAFREHDFFLGRQNCRSFLRTHFLADDTQLAQAGLKSSYMTETESEPDAPSPASGEKQIKSRSMSAPRENTVKGRNHSLYQRFGYQKPSYGKKPGSKQIKSRSISPLDMPATNGTGSVRYPIIPDVSIAPEEGAMRAIQREDAPVVDYQQVGIPWPKLFGYKANLRARFKGILSHYLGFDVVRTFSVKQLTMISALIWVALLIVSLTQSLGSSALILIAILMSITAVLPLLFLLLQFFALPRITNTVFNAIKSDFEKRGLIDRNKKNQ